MFAWDVINEAVLDDGSGVRDSVYNRVENFMCKAFTAAHKADPNALLFYNDYNIESIDGYTKAKSDKVYELVQDLVKRECPIHGIGI